MKTATDRIFNFSAGPAVLPLPVLEQVREDLLCLPGAGASILEISHRSSWFIEILDDAQQRLRRLLAIPDDYEIVFLQGGSRLQFSMVPANLLGSRTAEYVLTGSWSRKALAEAEKEGSVQAAWDGQAFGYDRVPSAAEFNASADAAYVHVCGNETIQGVQFSEFPQTGDVPLVCDSSSELLCRPLPMDRFGLIYACAQKNCGPAGVTVVIIRRDLLARSRDDMPGYLNYQNHVAERSLYNTPPTFAIYVLGLVARWLEEEIGGLAAMESRNQEKSRMLYEVIDESEGFYQGHAQPESRSMMNVCFRFDETDIQDQFLQQARDEGFGELKGHRSVGGIRASIYNAMPMEGVTGLRQFMLDFAQKNG